MSNESSDFKVQDRRKFNEVGDLRDDSNEAEPPKEPSNEPSPQQPDEQNNSDAAIHHKQLEPFPSLINFLATTAFLQMGLAPNPATNKTEKNITAAKEFIDILEVLQKKTKGNLDAEESELLNKCVHELKIHYVKASQNIIL